MLSHPAVMTLLQAWGSKATSAVFTFWDQLITDPVLGTNQRMLKTALTYTWAPTALTACCISKDWQGLKLFRLIPFPLWMPLTARIHSRIRTLRLFHQEIPPPLKKTLRALSTVVETVFDICIRRIWPKYGNIKCTCSLLLRGSSCFAEKQDIKQHLNGRQANHFKYWHTISIWA